MNMRVRICVLAVVLVAFGASSAFAQFQPTATAKNSFTVGAPAGSAYAGANHFNLAVNSEGNRELGAAVTICAGSPGGATAASTPGATTANFNVGDVFQIEYTEVGTTTNDPVFATPGALGAANLLVVQNGLGTGATATASAAMVQPAQQAGSTVVLSPLAIVTVTITGAPSNGVNSPGTNTGINCIAIQGMRFDLGNTVTSTTLVTSSNTTGAKGVGTSSIEAVVKEISVNGAAAGTNGAPFTLGLFLPNTDAYSNAGNTFGGVNGGLPPFASNVVASSFPTLLATGSLGIANPTGYVSGGFGVAGAATKTGFGAAAPSVTVGSSKTGSGAVSVQQNVITPTNGPAGFTCNPVCATLAVNLPIADGGGLFRGFVASGPDVTSWLNSSGATTGTQVTLTIAGMPTGSSVVFPSSVSSASPGVVLNMTGGGTVSAPGGTVTYSTTVNEGIPSTLLAGSLIGPSVDIPFTVSAGSAASSAIFPPTVVISVGPATGASAVPTYSQINGTTVVPTQALPLGPQTTLFTVANNQNTNTFPYVTFTGGTTSADYDTGIALTNTGRGVSVVAGAPCYNVPAGGTIPTGCGGATAGTVSTTGTNGGQDGPFTIFLLSSNATVASIRSTAANFPNAAKLTGGNLVQGSTWVALLSQITAAAGVTGAWSGQLVIVNDFPNSNGFAFVSQFTNPGGGATMGYKVTNILGEK